MTTAIISFLFFFPFVYLFSELWDFVETKERRPAAILFGLIGGWAIFVAALIGNIALNNTVDPFRSPPTTFGLLSCVLAGIVGSILTGTLCYFFHPGATARDD